MIKAIAYIWGSSHNVADTISSKDSRGKFTIVRPHNETHNIWYNESFDYKKDFQKAFGYAGYPAFIAIAADTDDSNAKTIAFIKDIEFIAEDEKGFGVRLRRPKGN